LAIRRKLTGIGRVGKQIQLFYYNNGSGHGLRRLLNHVANLCSDNDGDVSGVLRQPGY
jgi:hypothetical protein